MERRHGSRAREAVNGKAARGGGLEFPESIRNKDRSGAGYAELQAERAPGLVVRIVLVYEP